MLPEFVFLCSSGALARASWCLRCLPLLCFLWMLIPVPSDIRRPPRRLSRCPPGSDVYPTPVATPTPGRLRCLSAGAAHFGCLAYLDSISSYRLLGLPRAFCCRPRPSVCIAFRSFMICGVDYSEWWCSCSAAAPRSAVVGRSICVFMSCSMCPQA